MKHSFLITLALFITSISMAQSDCKIEDSFANIFKAEKMTHGEREFWHQSINELDEEDCFSELINQNSNHINYLRQHFLTDFDYEGLKAIEDESKLQTAYIQALHSDSTFVDLIKEMTNRKEATALDTVSLDQLLNLAVKFFNIKEITENDYYSGKICAGINGIMQTESDRKPHLEAFCFSTVLVHVLSEKFNLREEFIKGIKELYKLNLGLDKEENLLRAQGAMYFYMRNNTKLREALLEEYQQKQQYLPFILEE